MAGVAHMYVWKITDDARLDAIQQVNRKVQAFKTERVLPLRSSCLVFPMARRILLPLLLEIDVSIILLSDAQRHRASTG